MIDRYTHQQLRIGLVSPQQISTWSKKILSNGEIVGEVTKPYTFHYKTNKPEKDGLFCERIELEYGAFRNTLMKIFPVTIFKKMKMHLICFYIKN